LKRESKCIGKIFENLENNEISNNLIKYSQEEIDEIVKDINELDSEERNLILKSLEPHLVE